MADGGGDFLSGLFCGFSYLQVNRGAVEFSKTLNLSSNFTATYNSATNAIDIDVVNVTGAVPTTRTLAGDADIWIDGSATPKDLSANRAFTINATANATDGTIMRRNDSGGTGLNGIVVDAGATWLDSQAQSTTGSGTPRTWVGQAAKAGAYGGGSLDHITGARGNSDFWSGDFRIALGPEDDNETRSAYFSLFANTDLSGTPFYRVSSTGSVGTIEAPGGFTLITTSGMEIVLTNGDHSAILDGAGFHVDSVPTITGSRGGNAALASLLTALAARGLIVDGTS